MSTAPPTYGNKGEYDKAIEDCDKAIQIDSNNALAYANRGGMYLVKGDCDRAVADLEMAVKLEPDNGDYREILANAKAASGNSK
jgi:tetratricopeptide (TPR) repeat protein